MDLIGHAVSNYCETLIMSPCAKVRLFELSNRLKEKTYHEDRWVNKARKAIIMEAADNLVVAGSKFEPPNVCPHFVYVIDLKTCTILTMFLGRKNQKYLGLCEGSGL